MQVNNLKLILKWFELLLGLKINYEKCELMGIYLEQSLLASLAKRFGCKIGKLPISGVASVFGFA